MRISPPPARVLALALSVVLLGAGCGRQPAAPPPPPPVMELVPPLHDAQPGELLRIRRGGAQVNQYRVVSETDLTVEIEIIRFDETGEPMGPATTEVWSRNGWGLPAGGVIRKFEHEDVVVGGKTHRCWRIDFAHPTAGKYYYWIDPDLAVHGMVRVARDADGKPEIENAFLLEASEHPE